MKPKFQQSADTGLTSKDLLYGGPLPSLLLLNLLRPLIFYDLLALTAKTAVSEHNDAFFENMFNARFDKRFTKNVKLR